MSDAQAWQPNSLREAADSWQAAARDVHADIEVAMPRDWRTSTQEVWTGSAAQAARGEALALGRASDALARAMVMAAVAARDGADQIAAAHDRVLDLVAVAESEGFAVADDGTVSMDAGPTSLLVALSGGDASVAADLLALRAYESTRQIANALERLGAADADAAGDVEEAFATPISGVPATAPAGVVALRRRGRRFADVIPDASPIRSPRCPPNSGSDWSSNFPPRRATPTICHGDAYRREPDQHRPGGHRRARPEPRGLLPNAAG